MSVNAIAQDQVTGDVIFGGYHSSNPFIGYYYQQNGLHFLKWMNTIERLSASILPAISNVKALAINNGFMFVHFTGPSADAYAIIDSNDGTILASVDRYRSWSLSSQTIAIDNASNTYICGNNIDGSGFLQKHSSTLSRIWKVEIGVVASVAYINTLYYDSDQDQLFAGGKYLPTSSSPSKALVIMLNGDGTGIRANFLNPKSLSGLTDDITEVTILKKSTALGVGSLYGSFHKLPTAPSYDSFTGIFSHGLGTQNDKVYGFGVAEGDGCVGFDQYLDTFNLIYIDWEAGVQNVKLLRIHYSDLDPESTQPSITAEFFLITTSVTNYKQFQGFMILDVAGSQNFQYFGFYDEIVLGNPIKRGFIQVFETAKSCYDILDSNFNQQLDKVLAAVYDSTTELTSMILQTSVLVASTENYIIGSNLLDKQINFDNSQTCYLIGIHEIVHTPTASVNNITSVLDTDTTTQIDLGTISLDLCTDFYLQSIFPIQFTLYYIDSGVPQSILSWNGTFVNSIPLIISVNDLTGSLAINQVRQFTVAAKFVVDFSFVYSALSSNIPFSVLQQDCAIALTITNDMIFPNIAYYLGTGQQTYSFDKHQWTPSNCGSMSYSFTHINKTILDDMTFVTIDFTQSKIIVNTSNTTLLGSNYLQIQSIFTSATQTQTLPNKLMKILIVKDKIIEITEKPGFLQDIKDIDTVVKFTFQIKLPPLYNPNNVQTKLQIQSNKPIPFVSIKMIQGDAYIVAEPMLESQIGIYKIIITLKDLSTQRKQDYAFTLRVRESFNQTNEELEEKLNQPVLTDNQLYIIEQKQEQLYKEAAEKNRTGYLKAKIKSVKRDGNIVIQFDKELHIPKNLRTYLQKSLEIKIFQKYYQQEELPTNYEILKIDRNLVYLKFIPKTINFDYLSARSVDEIRVKFIQYYKYQNFEQNSYIPENTVISAQIPLKLQQKFMDFADGMGVGMAVTISSLIGANLLTNAVVTQSSQQLWGMLEGFQYISHLPLMSVTTPANTLYFFQLMNSIASFNLIQTDDLTNKQLEFDEYDETYYSDPFFMMGYESMNAIQNIGLLYYIILINGFLLFVGLFINFTGLYNKKQNIISNLKIFAQSYTIQD